MIFFLLVSLYHFEKASEIIFANERKWKNVRKITDAASIKKKHLSRYKSEI